MNHFQEALQFGKYAIEIGVLSQDQLTWALDQATQVGKERMVSDVLLDAGLLSVEDLEKVLRAIADGEKAQGSHGSNGNGAAPDGSVGPDGNGLAANGGEAPDRSSSPVAPAADQTLVSEGASMPEVAPPDLSALAPAAEEVEPDVAEGAMPEVDAPAPTSSADTSELEILGGYETGASAATPPSDETPPPPCEPFEPAAAPEPDPTMSATESVPAVGPGVESAGAPIDEPAAPAPPVSAPEAAAPQPAPPPAPAAAIAAEIPDEPSPAARGEAPSQQASIVLGWLEAAAAEGASDLHLHVGEVERTRVHGAFPKKSDGTPVTDAETEAFLRWVLTPAEWHDLETSGQIDFSHTLPGKVRLRCNAYRKQGGTDVVFRLIPWTPPTLEELGLPETLSRFADYHQGMVLFTGPSSCGKSSTLAAVVNLVNEHRPHHILTVEDPIEFLHASKQANVNQRQVGRHTGSFARALKAALREDPDVIVIGELRDLETIRLALTAAETGHLVLGTMHTRNAVGTINRLIGSFPPEEQAQIRTMVSESLRGIVSQRLVQKSDGTGQVAALEVLIATNAVSNLVRESKTFQIPSILQSGASLGMCLMDASLNQLLKSGQISRDEALRLCENPKSFGG